MRVLIILLAIVLMTASCKKDTPEPPKEFPYERINDYYKRDDTQIDESLKP